MIARMKFLGPEDQGRISPPSPGYQPAIHVQGEYTSCYIFPADESIDIFTFDQDYEVILLLVFPARYAHYFHPGDNLEFYEGSHKVAQGILLSL